MARPLLKKGQSLFDVILVFFVILIMGIMGLLWTYVSSELTGNLINTTIINESAEAVTALQAGDDLNKYWDLLALAVLIGFALSMMILGFFIRSHPIFLPIFIGLLVLGFIIMVVIQQVWIQFSEFALFQAIKDSDFTITNHILTFSGIYYSIIGLIAIVAIYAKPEGGRDF